MKKLYKHVHLVIDDKREYLDGSILINDGIIEDVFIHSNKNVEDAKEIDMKSKIFIPKFFELNNKIDKSNFTEPSKDYNESTKGISDITKFTTVDLNSNKAINLALSNRVYVEFGLDNSLNDSYVKFILKNIDADKLLLTSMNHDNIQKQIKRLKELNVSLTDIVAMTSINYYKFSSNNKQDGYLIKGKPANIVCLQENMDVEFILTEGEKDA